MCVRVRVCVNFISELNKSERYDEDKRQRRSREEQPQGSLIEEEQYISIGVKELGYESQGDDGQQMRLQECEKKKGIGMNNRGKEEQKKNKARIQRQVMLKEKVANERGEHVREYEGSSDREK